MKANEAPEKIYLTPLECMAASCQPQKDNTVEYIRIESVIEWLNNKAEKYIVDTPLCSYFDYKRAVEDFKNYMKGE